MNKGNPTDWQKSQQEFAAICTELTALLIKNTPVESPAVQHLIARHHAWLCTMWTPTQDSYIGLAQTYESKDFEKAFEGYHPQLAHYISRAMQIYAKTNLS